jgi:hypothetical protein
MRLRCIPETFYERVPLQHRLHDPSLDPLAAAMNQPDFSETGFVRCGDVLLDDGGDIAGMKSVKVQG